MKKILNIFLVFVMFLVFPFNIYADGAEVRHIAMIDSFNLKDGKIKFGGYAFFSHQDNYGINNNGYGNLQNYIVAYVGEWDNKYVICDNKSDSDCMIYTGNAVDRDMWFSRCINKGCFQERENYEYRRGSGTSEEEWLKFATDNNRGFINSNKCHHMTRTGIKDPKFGNAEIVTQCIYENVEFKVTIDLKTLVNKLGHEKIHFKIVSINTNLINVDKISLEDIDVIFNDYEQKKEKNEIVDHLAIGVSNMVMHPSACRNGAMGDNCINLIKGKFYDSGYNVFLGGFTESALYDANDAWPKNSSGLSVKDKSNNIVYYKTGSSFKVWQISSKDTAQRGYDEFYNNIPVKFDVNSCFNMSYTEKKERCINKTLSEIQYKEYLVHLDTKNSGNLIVPGDGILTNDDNDDIDYWAVSSHLVFDGDFYIEKYQPAYESYTCEQLFPGNEITSASFSCNEDNERNKKFNQCIDNQTLNSTIYIDKFESNTCMEYKNGRIPVNISSKIAINQQAKFEISKINDIDNAVRAGKGFTLDNWKYISLIQWSYSDWWIKSDDKDFSPYYTALYDPDGDNIPNNYYLYGGCATNGISVDEVLRRGKKFYYVDSSGNQVLANNLNDAIYHSLDVAFNKEYYKNEILNSGDDFTESLNDYINKNIKFQSCDSNSSSTECEPQLVNGVWKYNILNDSNNNKVLIAHAPRYITNDLSIKNLESASNKLYENEVGAGSYFTMNYYLPYSYISLANYDKYNYSDIVYSATSIAYDERYFYKLGNKYFVGIKFASDLFPFNLVVDVNPSLISGMNWILNGTCDIKVDNGLFDDRGKPLYRYRAISLNNPFPRVTGFGYPINWEEWMSSENFNENISRLSNTYTVSDARKYSTVISKLDGINNATSIMAINEYGNGKFYGDMIGIDKFGTSEFVKPSNNYFNKVASNETYCGLGFFSSSCDNTLR